MNPADTPANTCDCHMHIYEDSYPLAATATFKPPHAPVTAYKKVQQALGLQRVVLVQPTGYGFDNRCMLDALPQFGAAARGICIVPPETTDAELQRLHAAGVRGLRYMMIVGGGGPLQWDSLEAMAARITPLGWHINLQLDGRDLPKYKSLIDRVPCNLVIDHIGKFLEPVPPEHESFKALLAVLDRPDRWVKLSAPYETSKSGPPHYEDVAVLARALLRAHPDRCLWASNWPYPNRNPAPPTEAMLDLLTEWASDEKLREAVLVRNPERLYAF